MLRLICGPAGSGKSTEIMRSAADIINAGGSAFLIVPEQEAVVTERMAAELLPASSPLSFEVFGFSRLSNHLCRSFGGLSYNYASSGVKLLIMYRTLCELSGVLTEFGSAEPDEGRVRAMLSAREQLLANRVSAAALERAAASEECRGRLSAELLDLSAICTLYDALLREKYTDSSSDIETLANILDAHPECVANSDVFIDSFTSFTAYEYAVIERLLLRAKSLTVALCADRSDSLAFAETRDTRDRLLAAAAKNAIPSEETNLAGNHRASAAALSHICGSLWDFTAPKTTADDSVKLIAATDPYDEAELVAVGISEAVRSGLRYRDIAVFSRNTDNYKGIIDTVFKKYNIPYFLSDRTPVEACPAVRLLYSAVSLAVYGFRRADLIACLKTGLLDFTDEETDIFESYTTAWNLSGRRLTDGVPFTANPDGWTSKLTERGEYILSVANSVKERLIPPLEAFCDTLSRPSTVREFCAASYELLTRLSALDNMKNLVADAAERGDSATAAGIPALAAAFMRALDETTDALGDYTVNAAAFLRILRLCLGGSGVSLIPTSADAVLIGSAGMTRTPAVRRMYIIGACEGEFPAGVSSGSFFSENDMRLLRSLGIDMTPPLNILSARELFFFYRALSFATDAATVSYHAADLAGEAKKPSLAVTRIRDLLSDIHITESAEIPPQERAINADTARELLPFASDPSFRAAIAELVPDALPTPDAEREEITPELTNEIFGQRLSLSQTSLRLFTDCKFAYYCKYILRLEEIKPHTFDYLGVGNLAHAVLERAFAKAVESGADLKWLGKRTLGRLVGEAAEEYIHSVCRDERELTPRVKATVRRVVESARFAAENIAAEFAASDFSPLAFEMKIASAPDCVPPLVFPFGGREATLGGVIDRVDAKVEDGCAYVRVTDYKTGVQKFSLDGLDAANGLQLLIYLNTLAGTGAREVRRRLSLPPDAPVYPAGALYMQLIPDSLSLDAPESAADIDKIASVNLSRSGILLDDPRLLRGMGTDFIPVKENKDGSLAARGKSALLTQDGMTELFRTVADIVSETSAGIVGGNAEAKPRHLVGNACECAFCAMRAVCRKGRV